MTIRERFRFLTLTYTAVLIGVIVTANLGWLPVKWLLRLPAGDKVGHFLLMGLLSFLGGVSFGLARGRRGLLSWSLGLWLLVALEETSQVWLDRRAFEPADLLADTAGIAVFALLASVYLARRELFAAEFRRQS